MSLKEVYIDELRDLYSAENQLVKALPKLAKATSDPQFKTLLTEHLEQTKGQVERLKQIFQQLGAKPTGEQCKGMQGLVEEANEQLEKGGKGPELDARLGGACLRVEHYEMAGYSTAISLAKALGEKEAAQLLTETLHEEQQAGKNVVAAAKPVLKQASQEPSPEEQGSGGSGAAKKSSRQSK